MVFSKPIFKEKFHEGFNENNRLVVYCESNPLRLFCLGEKNIRWLMTYREGFHPFLLNCLSVNGLIKLLKNEYLQINISCKSINLLLKFSINGILFSKMTIRDLEYFDLYKQWRDLSTIFPGSLFSRQFFYSIYPE